MDFRSKRKRKRKRKPPVGTPICHHTKEAYNFYKGYKSDSSFFMKRSRGKIILMAMPEYNKDGTIGRYQRVYVDLDELQPYYNKFLENIDFVLNVKEEEN